MRLIWRLIIVIIKGMGNLGNALTTAACSFGGKIAANYCEKNEIDVVSVASKIILLPITEAIKAENERSTQPPGTP